MTQDKAIELATDRKDLRAARTHLPLAFGFVAITCGYIFVRMLPLAPDYLVLPWGLVVAAKLIVWLAVLTVAERQGDGRQLQAVRQIITVSDAALIAAVAGVAWLFMPYADPALRMLLAFFALGFVINYVVMSPATIDLTGFAVVAILGSFGVWYLASDDPMRLPGGLFALSMGAGLMQTRRALARNVRKAFRDRMAAEAARDELAVALAEVAAARDAKTRFIAAASHDLAQPVQAAGLFFEAALATGDMPARARATDGVREALASASALLGQMLDHLRLEAGGMRGKARPLAAGPLVARIASAHALTAKAAGLRLKVMPTARWIVADPLLCERAVGNLIANAIRHSKGARIVVGVRVHDDRARIWVIDDGRGVAAAEAADIFADYSQGSSDAPGGFGIGLPSAVRAAAAMGGLAGLDARWVHGAAFYIDLPTAPDPELLCEAA